MGDLYVALVTLTFGLLMENLVFTLPVFVNQGLGITLNRPTFATSDRAFTYLCLVVFIVLALFIVNFRRSTTGLALNAARWSENGARTSGISVVQMKVIAGALAAFIAGIGGGLLGLAQTTFQPSEFATFLGVIWLAVFVTIGIRSNAAALIGGLAFVFPAALAQYYFSTATWIPNVLPRALWHGSCLGGQVPRRRPGRKQSTAATARTTRDLSAPPWADSGSGRAGAGAVTAISPTTAPKEAGSAPALAATGVTVRYGGLTALSNVSVQVPTGTVVGLVGPNGAGKSTLLGVLSGLVQPNDGDVWIRGQEVTNASARSRAKLGLARTFQQPELFLGLTVREHLVVAHRARVSPNRMWRDMFDPRSLLPPSKAENERVDGLLEQLTLTRVAKAPVAALPLGILRLVEMGRALAADPRVLLLDEPLSGLDMKASQHLLSLFRTIVDNAASPISLLIVEHDVAAVLALSDSVVVLDFGECIATGTPEEIRNDPKVRSAYLGDAAGLSHSQAPSLKAAP